MEFKNLFTNQWFCAFLLAALSALCFAQVLQSYFLADDIWQVAYIADIAHGNSSLLWHNFTGNFLDIPSSSIYRPLIALSMLTDFWLWKVNASGWFGTNVLFYIGNVMLVFSLARKLELTYWQRITFAPLFSGALFATYPLHCEAVCWLAGRSDLICSFFFLLALYLELAKQSVPITDKSASGTHLPKVPQPASRRNMLTASALIAFWLALLSKEMAVVMPCVVFLFALLSPRANDRSSGFSRAVRALRQTLPYILSVLIYFALRLKFLGTVGGGYADTLAMLMRQSEMGRLLDLKTIYRLFFPFPQGIFGDAIIEPALLSMIYLALLIAGLRTYPRRLLFVLMAWCAVCILPVMQMWGLGPDLEASRIYFFASVPACIAAGLLVSRSDRKWLLVPAALVVALWYQSAHALCGVWTETGTEVHTIADEAASLTRARSGNIIVLPVPKENHGALMITNGGMFLHLLAPPYRVPDLSKRFVVFDRIFTEPDQFINAERFKSAMADSENSGPYLWTRGKFARIDLQQDKAAAPPLQIAPGQIRLNGANKEAKETINIGADEMDATHLQKTNSFMIKDLDVNPLSFDFIEMELAISGKPRTEPQLSVAWDTIDPEIGRGLATTVLKGMKSNEFRKVSLRLSHQWRWYATPKVHQILMSIAPCDNVQIRNVRMVSAEQLVPKLTCPGGPAGNGVVYLNGKPLTLRFDASQIPGASAVELEVSRLNYMFDSFDYTDSKPAVLSRVTVARAVGSTTLPVSTFVGKGYQQIRCRAISAQSPPLGDFSDAITIFQ